MLVAVGFGVGEADVVVSVPEHLAGTDLALGIAAAACFITYLQRGRVIAGMGDVVDRAAQGQRALIKAVGAAQHLDAALPQGVLELVRCTARAGQRQTVEHFIQPGRMGAGAAVQSGTANRELHAFIVRRLGVHPRLVLEHIFVSTHPPLLHAAHVDVVGATGHVF